jgi:RNA polymerase sigma-70 factor (ECF subfamily)
MDETWLAEHFEAHRSRLRAIAGRMLGSHAEAEDVVQDVWLRVCGHDADGVRNLGGWLTTVTARICLDHLRARALRPVVPLEEAELPGDGGDPEEAAVLADSVGAALLVVLDTLAPAERLAFVLHDPFDVPFAEIAAIVDRSPDAAKMLASRARRRIRGAGPVVASDLARQRAVVDAFLTAARRGRRCWTCLTRMWWCGRTPSPARPAHRSRYAEPRTSPGRHSASPGAQSTPDWPLWMDRWAWRWPRTISSRRY